MNHISTAAAKTISHVTAHSARLAAADVARVREIVQATDPDDDDLLADMIEGETTAYELADALLDVEAEAKATADALKARIDALTARKRRMEARADNARLATLHILNATGLRKMELEQATISARMTQPKAVVDDPHALPPQFIRTKVEADLSAIKAAGGDIPGVRWEPGRQSLTVRRT